MAICRTEVLATRAATAKRVETQGVVAGRFRVKEDESAADCVVEFSSGNATLDQASGAAVPKRARYNAAPSKDGCPGPSAQFFFGALVASRQAVTSAFDPPVIR